MPLYEYKSQSGQVLEHICKYDERPASIVDDGITYLLALSQPARLALSWATNPWGVSGKFDTNLQSHVMDHKHRDAVMKEKGIVKMDSTISRELESKASTLKDTRKRWAAGDYT